MWTYEQSISLSDKHVTVSISTGVGTKKTTHFVSYHWSIRKLISVGKNWTVKLYVWWNHKKRVY